MYIYIYDDFLIQKKYNKILAKIETKITDLGLNGRIIRLNLMNSVYNAVEDEVKRGAKTIVAVGQDKLVNQVINSVATLQAKNIGKENIPISIIPIGKTENKIAEFLGINSEEEACQILSARRIETLPLAQANNNYFLGQAIMPAENTVIIIDNNYTLEVINKGIIAIINLPIDNRFRAESVIKITANKLQLIILTSGNRKFLPGNINYGHNKLYCNKLYIINKKEPIRIDDSFKIPTPVEIKITKEKINLIVDRNRKY